MKVTRRQLQNLIRKGLAEACGDKSEGSPSGNRGPADANRDGVIDPDELYMHFDVDSDGVVTPDDYAQHVEYHCERPDILQPYLDHRENVKDIGIPCPNSYKAVGDSLISSPSEVMKMIKPIMKMTGAKCPASTAQAMADVVHFANMEKYK
mgnify:CR=1 FL=1